MKKFYLSVISLFLLGCSPYEQEPTLAEPEKPKHTIKSNTIAFLKKQKYVVTKHPKSLISKLSYQHISQKKHWKENNPTSYQQTKNPYSPNFRIRDFWLIPPEKVTISDISPDGEYRLEKGLPRISIAPFGELQPELFKQSIYMAMKCTYAFDDDAMLFHYDIRYCEDGYPIDDALHAELIALFSDKPDKSKKTTSQQ